MSSPRYQLPSAAFPSGSYSTGPSRASPPAARLPGAAVGRGNSPPSPSRGVAGHVRTSSGSPGSAGRNVSFGGRSDRQHFADLGAAFGGLEGFDEASSVGQAQLLSRMQSNLANASEDTPRLQGYDYSDPRRKNSLAGRAAGLTAEDFPEPGPEYRGPRMESLDDKIKIDWAMKLVKYFQQNQTVPLPARYLCRILAEAERIMIAKQVSGPIWQVEVPTEGAMGQNQSEPRLVVVGDTHGQLQDVLWIFYKLGVPSLGNRYLVNGDICDRGPLAVEIWALFLCFMCVFPDSVVIQRGNHEDRTMNMDGNCGGFYDELLGKYGRYDGNGALLYEKFGRLFSLLPLASIVDNRIFVVHGGLSRNMRGFMRLLKQCRVRRPEIPESSATASAVDLAVVDAMWADPQELRGVTANPRGAGLILFGPDVTQQFLNENRLELVVRSHQLPDTYKGFGMHHGGKLLTVFSASNYCGVCQNEGAVLTIFQDGKYEPIGHFAPSFAQLATMTIERPELDGEKTPASVRAANAIRRKSQTEVLEKEVLEAKSSGEEAARSTERLEREVLWRAARLIVERKTALYEYWQEVDGQPATGFIDLEEWVEGMSVVLGGDLPWTAIGKVLQVSDKLSKDVDYRRFLNRFRVTLVSGHQGGDKWAEELLGRFYGRLLSLKGDAGSLSELEGFLGHGSDKVSRADAFEVFQWVLGNTVTEDQANAMLRTLAAHNLPDPSPTNNSRPLGVFEFLSRLDVCYQRQTAKGVTMADSKGAQQDKPAESMKKAPPWVTSVLNHVGRLIWMEDAHGSPKAGNDRMLAVFRHFDENNDGLLARGEFAKAVKTLLREYAAELPSQISEETATSDKINELVDYVDVSGDGVINYLEFLHAFQPVDRTPGRGLRMDLMEKVYTTIWANKPSLLRTLQLLEESLETSASDRSDSLSFSGMVSRENLKRTLRSLNASLAGGQAGRAPLTRDQIDLLVDHGAFDSDDRLNYLSFLDAIQVEDTDPPSGDPTSPLEEKISPFGFAYNPAPRPAATGSKSSPGASKLSNDDRFGFGAMSAANTRGSSPGASSSPSGRRQNSHSPSGPRTSPRPRKMS